jgi:hypothetical protein
MFEQNKDLAQQRIYYEIKLKDAFITACDNREQVIPGEETWTYFVALLLRTKLCSIKDSELLNKFRPSFPLTFDTFMQTVT